MKKLLLLIIPFIFLLVAIIFKQEKNKHIEIKSKNQKIEKKISKIDYNSPKFFENYVIDVMINGSDIFKYPSGPMDGGYVSKNEAEKIASYMATLQGLKPSHPEWVQEGAALFNGNCTGCHGVGGKGKKGYFPDLTRKPLLGIEMLKKSKGYH
ncbi:c-type cytochrome [Nitrosophilus kaiyonis]|uniref:c-type cytochrome n=1 Tax=Nitrosophilus kaiyonis TaxID=2930200 RepID=UPI002492D5E7|nr:c-type cytochrome [Nitrosophilus kaiyonis]